ncbi:MAG: energy-coupling factor ABC transporter permease [Deltaproteobacteria bacterium]|nr:energy-coupling factor ABC transporter permease [Deltaproteobacteria bacterium]
MHMADALISPAVGATMWAASAGLIGYCSKKLKEEANERSVPLMGVLGAFIFAAQMINFTIPATGSSGHLGGGMILAILLGPYSGFLTISSVLIIQALFFADGGLLALGCNIFNLGFFPCFIAYPFIYKKIVGKNLTKAKIIAAAVISAVIGLQLGAFGVVLETFASGVSELAFNTFLIIMMPIHLAIGLVEGAVTAGTVLFVLQARPEILKISNFTQVGDISVKKLIIKIACAAMFIGAILSWFASYHPDGLEWAMFKTAGTEEIEPPEKNIYSSLSDVQTKTAFLPDYGFKAKAAQETEKWPAIDAGTSTSGIIGGTLTLLTACLIGFLLKKRRYGTVKKPSNRGIK